MENLNTSWKKAAVLGTVLTALNGCGDKKLAEEPKFGNDLTDISIETANNFDISIDAGQIDTEQRDTGQIDSLIDAVRDSALETSEDTLQENFDDVDMSSDFIIDVGDSGVEFFDSMEILDTSEILDTEITEEMCEYNGGKIGEFADTFHDFGEFDDQNPDQHEELCGIMKEMQENLLCVAQQFLADNADANGQIVDPQSDRIEREIYFDGQSHPAFVIVCGNQEMGAGIIKVCHISSTLQTYSGADDYLPGDFNLWFILGDPSSYEASTEIRYFTKQLDGTVEETSVQLVDSDLIDGNDDESYHVELKKKQEGSTIWGKEYRLLDCDNFFNVQTASSDFLAVEEQIIDFQGN